MANLLDQYLGFIRKCIPTKPPAPAVGIDIGLSDCKLVHIIKKNDEIELIRWDSVPIKEGNVNESIQSLLGGLESPCKNPYTAITGKGTLIRFVDLPRMPIDELKKSFDIESDKYFPFPPDQIYTDCFILNPQGKERKMSVMAAAAKKDMIDERIELLRGLGLQTDFVGLNSVALLNAVNKLGIKSAGDAGDTVAVLDMGDAVSSLSILVDNIPLFTRDIYIGGKEFTKRIQDAFGVTLQEAEEMKKNPGAKEQEIMTACEAVATNILQEIRLSIDYFSSEKNKELSRLYLTGGAAMLNGINETFAKHFNVSVEVWDPFERVKISEDMRKDMGKTSLKLGVALGLALYDYD